MPSGSMEDLALCTEPGMTPTSSAWLALQLAHCGAAGALPITPVGCAAMHSENRSSIGLERKAGKHWQTDGKPVTFQHQSPNREMSTMPVLAKQIPLGARRTPSFSYPNTTSCTCTRRPAGSSSQFGRDPANRNVNSGEQDPAEPCRDWNSASSHYTPYTRA